MFFIEHLESEMFREISTRSVLWKKVHLKLSQYSQENTFVAVSCLQACNFVKKRLWHRCFLVNIAKFLKTSTWKNGCFWTIFFFFLHFNLFLVSTIVIYYENMTKSSMEFKNKHRIKRWSRITLKNEVNLWRVLDFMLPLDSAKSRGFRGKVGYVGAWVALIKF